MNFDPRLVAPQPGAVIIPDEVVVEQELLNFGLSYDQAEAAMDQAARELGDADLEVNAANMAQQLSQDIGISVAVPTADQINDAKAAIAAAQGGTVTPSGPTGTLEQMQADIQTLKDEVSQLQQQEALNTEAIVRAVFKELGDRITGPASAAADVDAIEGGQPVAEQAQAEAAANPQ